MTSLREFPVRRQPPSRPPWLLPAIIVGAVAVGVAVVILVVRMLGGSDEAADAEAAPEPSCSTVMVAPSDELPVPEKVKVNVYNATETSGLASKTARDLKKRGFVIRDVANDPVAMPIEGVARIRFGPSSAKRAELLSYYFPGAELVELDRSGPKVDVALGDAYVLIPPQPDIDAILNKPEAVLMGPGCFGSVDADPSASEETPGDAPGDAPEDSAMDSAVDGEISE